MLSMNSITENRIAELDSKPDGFQVPSFRRELPVVTVESASARNLQSSFEQIPNRPDLGIIRSTLHRWEHRWLGLPTACKTLLVLALVSTFLTVAFAIVIFDAGENGEAVHVSVLTVIGSSFMCVCLFDAILYENALELITAAILDALTMARALSFVVAVQKEYKALVICGIFLASFQVLNMTAAVLSYRQFGWRVLSHVGVDVRRQDAAAQLRASMAANAFNACYRFAFIFVVLVTTLGILVAAEDPNGSDPLFMTLTIVLGLISTAAIVLYVFALARAAAGKTVWLVLMDANLLILLLQPALTLGLYTHLDETHDGVAHSSMIVLASFLTALSVLVWILFRVAYRFRNSLQYYKGRFNLSVATDSFSSDCAVLHPLLVGEWLGKPAPNRQKKIRFFQLSKDYSTLRWGWDKYVRLYYIERMDVDKTALTLTLYFVADNPLVLKFQGAVELDVWKQGLRKAVEIALAPGGDSRTVPTGVESRGNSDLNQSLPQRRTSRFRLQQFLRVEVPGGEMPGTRLSSRPGVSGSSVMFPAAATVSLPGSMGGSQRRTYEGSIPSADQLRKREVLARHLSWLASRRHVAEELEAMRSASAVELTSGTDIVGGGDSPVLIKLSRSVELQRPRRPQPKRLRSLLVLREDQSKEMDVGSDRGEAIDGVASAALTEEARQDQPGARASVGVPSAAGTAVFGERERDSISHVVIHRPSPMASVSTKMGPFQEVEQQQSSVAATAQDPGLGPASSPFPSLLLAGSSAPEIPLSRRQDSSSPLSDELVASRYMAALAAMMSGGPESSSSVLPAPGGLSSLVSGEVLSEDEGSVTTALPSAVMRLLDTGRSPEQALGDSECSSRSTPGPAPGVSFAAPLHPSTVAASARVASLLEGGGVAASLSGGMTLQLEPGSMSIESQTSPPGKVPAISVEVVEWEELSIERLLGQGAEACVHTGWLRDVAVAVKSFPREIDAVHEVTMYLAAGRHENLVALRGLCRHAGGLHLVLEYCPRGTLDVMLHHSSRRPWDPAKLLLIARSIAEGLDHLHARGIVHRDLKPANIFVSVGAVMKLGDLGCARHAAPSPRGGCATAEAALRRLTPGVVGTVQYAAPEQLDDGLRPAGSAWAPALDTWSYGVVLWELLSRRRPYEGLAATAVQARWLARSNDARLPPLHRLDAGGNAGLGAGRTPPRVREVLRGLASLADDCMAVDPLARPDMQDIITRIATLQAQLAGKRARDEEIVAAADGTGPKPGAAPTQANQMPPV